MLVNVLHTTCHFISINERGKLRFIVHLNQKRCWGVLKHVLCSSSSIIIIAIVYIMTVKARLVIGYVTTLPFLFACLCLRLCHLLLTCSRVIVQIAWLAAFSRSVVIMIIIIIIIYKCKLPLIIIKIIIAWSWLTLWREIKLVHIFI